MSAPYYSIITNNGLIKHAEASANAASLDLTELAVGDSNGVDYDPLPENTALQNELHRVNLTHVVVDENNPTQLIIEGVIDETVGPFFVREIGIFDSDGDLFALGKYPETFKSNLPSGVGKKLFIRMILGFSNAPNVTLIASDVNNDPNFSSFVNDELYDRLKISENLADLNNAEAARNNIEVYSKNYLNSKIGKNHLINGNFDIWQRSSSAIGVTNYGYFAPDRFAFNTANAIANITRQDFDPGQSDVPNNPKHFLRYELTTPGTLNAILYNRLEDVRSLSGQTCTLSFYAKADSPIVLTTDFQQLFGSGGSATVDGNADKVEHNLTTSWQKFTATFDIYSIFGKTIGSSSYLQMRWYFPNTSNVAVDFAHIKIEKGLIAGDFIPKHITEELALCQRYYCSSKSISPTNLDEFYMLPRDSAGQINRQTIAFPVLMRSSPTMSITRTNGTANLGAFAEVNERGFRKSIGGGQYEMAEYVWTADAEL